MTNPTNQLRAELAELTSLNQVIAFVSGLGAIDPELGKAASKRASEIAQAHSNQEVERFAEELKDFFDNIPVPTEYAPGKMGSRLIHQTIDQALTERSKRE